MRIGTDIELFLDRPARELGIPDELIDGLCLEIPTMPASSLSELKSEIDAIVEALDMKKHIVSEFVIPDIFDRYGPNIPHKDLEMGCQPEYGIDGMMIPKKKKIPMRSAGGHIHIDYAKDALPLVEALDCSILLVDYLIDTDKKALRMTNYGRAGAHRIKPYGVEYRSLSNQWYFNARIRDRIDALLPRVIDDPDTILFMARKHNLRNEVYVRNNLLAGERFLNGI